MMAPRLSCGMWDLVPWSGIKPGRPALEVQSLSHWTPREVPRLIINPRHQIISKACPLVRSPVISTGEKVGTGLAGYVGTDQGGRRGGGGQGAAWCAGERWLRQPLNSGRAAGLRKLVVLSSQPQGSLATLLPPEKAHLAPQTKPARPHSLTLHPHSAAASPLSAARRAYPKWTLLSLNHL